MNANDIEQIVDSLEEYGNQNGTEAQLNKAVELRALVNGIPTVAESERLEALGNREGTEAQLNEVSSLLQAELAEMPDKASEDFLGYPDVRLLLRYKLDEA